MSYLKFLIILVFLYGCKKAELIKEITNPDFLYINTTDDCSQLYAPLNLKFIGPIVNEGDSIEWIIDKNEKFKGTEVIQTIDTDKEIKYNVSMFLKKKNKEVFTQNKVLIIKPAPDTISITGISITVSGIPNYVYDFPNALDSLGRPDVYAELYDMSGKKLPVNLSADEDYIDGYSLRWMFNKPIENWPLNKKLEVRIFDFDKETNSYQQIGKDNVNFTNIIDFKDSKHYKVSRKCYERFPVEFKEYKSEDSYVKGLESKIFVSWNL